MTNANVLLFVYYVETLCMYNVHVHVFTCIHVCTSAFSNTV